MFLKRKPIDSLRLFTAKWKNKLEKIQNEKNNQRLPPESHHNAENRSRKLKVRFKMYRLLRGVAETLAETNHEGGSPIVTRSTRARHAL